jgi:hypothetical protein
MAPQPIEIAQNGLGVGETGGNVLRKRETKRGYVIGNKQPAKAAKRKRS